MAKVPGVVRGCVKERGAMPTGKFELSNAAALTTQTPQPGGIIPDVAPTRSRFLGACVFTLFHLFFSSSLTPFFPFLIPRPPVVRFCLSLSPTCGILDPKSCCLPTEMIELAWCYGVYGV